LKQYLRHLHDEHFTMEHNGAFLVASPGFDAEIQAQNGNQQSGSSNDLILQNSGQVVAEEVDVNAVGSVSCWPNCVPQHVYDQLREITDAKDAGINGKVFYKSYDKTERNIWSSGHGYCKFERQILALQLQSHWIYP
jgi:hypothetical protein